MRLKTSEIKNFKYWFELVDDSGTLASCQVYPVSSLFCPEIRYYMITDVYVPEQHRGNQYAGALLLNVMDRLTRRHAGNRIPPFRIASLRENEAAIRCYTRVFGAPYLTTRRLVHFSSDPADRKRKSWFSEKMCELFL
jgi:hypothetical protein